MSPNSDLKLGDNQGNRLFTNILQSLGTLLFQVEKNPRQKFQVTTPYLAATVKGTTFTVSVRPEGAAVHVTNGAVQVAARSGQRAVIVRPGQTGSVSSKPGAEVEIRKREGKSGPAPGATAGEGSESGSAEKSGNANNKATNKAQGKGLARALGTQPVNFNKLTKGFAGNAGNVANRGKAASGNSKVRKSAVGAVASKRSNSAAASRGKSASAGSSSNGGGKSNSSAGGSNRGNSSANSSNRGNSNANSSNRGNSNAGGNSGGGNAGGNSGGGNAGGNSGGGNSGNSGGGNSGNSGGNGKGKNK